MDHERYVRKKKTALLHEKTGYFINLFTLLMKTEKHEPLAKHNSTLKPMVIIQNYFLLNSEPFEMVINQQTEYENCQKA